MRGSFAEIASGLLLWLIIPFAIVAVSWSAFALQPAPGIDESWVGGLYAAAHQGLHYGSRIVFTYGPLGFLTQPIAFNPSLTQFALLYELLVRLGVAIMLFHGARRAFGTLAGIVVAWLVLALSVGVAQEGELAIQLAVCVWVLRTGKTGSSGRLIAVAVGAWAGLETLTKVSIGPQLLLIAIVMALFAARERLLMLGLVLAGFVVSLIAFWLLSGQALGDLPAFTTGSASVALGYTAAMMSEQPGLGWQYLPALLSLGLGIWAAWVTIDGGRRARIGGALVWAAFWFAGFKEGFVRHDAGHGLYFFVEILLGVFAFRWRAGQRAFALSAMAAIVTIIIATQAITVTAQITPAHSVSSFGRQVADIFDTSALNRAEAAGKRAIRTSDTLDLEARLLLAGHSMFVYPIEQAYAFGWNLNWDPPPDFQSYAAYTTRLDRLNARYIDSPRAAQRILYTGTPGIDSRIGAFDESMTLRAIFCRYHIIYSTTEYAILARGRDRCDAAPTRLRSVHAAWGQQVSVPAPPPHSMVYVDIDGTPARGFGSLESLFYKPPGRTIAGNGAPPNELITGTASDGLVLRMAKGTDWASPWNIEQGTTRLAVGGGSGGGRPLTFTFYAQRVS